MVTTEQAKELVESTYSMYEAVFGKTEIDEATKEAIVAHVAKFSDDTPTAEETVVIIDHFFMNYNAVARAKAQVEYLENAKANYEGNDEVLAKIDAKIKFIKDSYIPS